MSYEVKIEEVDMITIRTKSCIFAYIQIIQRSLNQNIVLFHNIPPSIQYFCVAYYPRPLFRFHETQLLLQESMKHRLTKSDVADLGIIDDSGMAASLQPTALRLNRKLTERKSKDDINHIISCGILPSIHYKEKEIEIETQKRKELRKIKKNRPSNRKKIKKNRRLSKRNYKEKIKFIEKKVNFEELHSIDINEQFIVFGFIRNLSQLFTFKNNPPPLICYICLHYYYIAEYQCGDQVLLTGQRTGIIRYIGKPHFAKDERIGIELNKWTPTGHNGKVGKFRYFIAKYGHAIFVTQTAIIKKLSNKSNGNQFVVGNYVLLTNDRKGVIRFIGSTLVGVELDKPDLAGHDDGKSYFSCKNGHGILVRLSDVVTLLDHEANKSICGIKSRVCLEMSNTDSTDDELQLMPVKVGDLVVLQSGFQGKILFIGETDFAKGELLGLEIISRDMMGHDGSRNNKRYFQCKPGKGIWTRRQKVVKILETNAWPSDYKLEK